MSLPSRLGKSAPRKTVRNSFDDPAKADGDEEDRFAVFRRVRDEIHHRLPGFIETDKGEINNALFCFVC
jgi:hypothetical protein